MNLKKHAQQIRKRIVDMYILPKADILAVPCQPQIF